VHPELFRILQTDWSALRKQPPDQQELMQQKQQSSTPSSNMAALGMRMLYPQQRPSLPFYCHSPFR
jgi:hypothetical protein